MSNANAGAKETLPEGLAALMARAGSARGPAPVERWDPPYCGEIDMRIAADGRWFYEGGPIGRERLVRLFSTVLRRDEDGHHYLVTPVERLRITVEDAPFLAVEFSALILSLRLCALLPRLAAARHVGPEPPVARVGATRRRQPDRL